MKIVSLKYSAGLTKEVIHLANCFRNAGKDTTAILCPKYEAIVSSDYSDAESITYLPKSWLAKLRSCLEMASSKEPILFYNSHPLNLVIQAIRLLRGRRRTAIVIHEPNKTSPIATYGAYGIVVHIITMLNKLQSWLCSDVILLSPHANRIYRSSLGYNLQARLHLGRILLPESPPPPSEPRKFFSFFGSVVAAKKIDWFLNLVEYCHSRSHPYKFIVVSSSKLPNSRISQLQSEGADLTIVNPKPLTDSVISQYLFQSAAAISMHRSVTQSGVFVECMRHQTPVICLDEPGFRQFVDGCGLLVSNPHDPQEIAVAIGKIEDNLTTFSQRAAQIYRSHFSEQCFAKYYRDLLEGNPEDTFPTL